MNTATAHPTPKPAKDRIIVALDVPTPTDAISIVEELSGSVGAFKVGLQLFTSAGRDFVGKLVNTGSRIFLDLKFHDIPNTVARASVEAARLGVWMFNVHASGGGEMMRQAVDEVTEACEREGINRPLIIAVTVLTSSNDDTLKEIGIVNETQPQVLKLAELTAECGLDGVVASPLEIEPIRARIASKEFVIVTPGIRPASATKDDQKRVMTPAEAVQVGADHLVIGRPITSARDRLKAVEQIVEEITSGNYPS
ncbi:MAG: orotidine-5'-phosphate decarboxylase [Pyrinomonadaceae bacterium]